MVAERSVNNPAHTKVNPPFNSVKWWVHGMLLRKRRSEVIMRI